MQNQLGTLSSISQLENEFATSIAEDYLDDLAYFDEKTFKANANTQCFLLSIFGHIFGKTPTGYFKYIFAPEKDQIDPFKELLFGLMDEGLRLFQKCKFLS